MNKIVRSCTLLPLCILVLCAMGACVQYSKSYASSHPMDGLQLKMTYCIEMPSTIGVVQDVGCKEGHGIGKVGVKKDVVRKIAERLNMDKESPAYRQLVSSDGLHMVLRDESLGSKGDVTVWQNAETGRMKIQVCKEN